MKKLTVILLFLLGSALSHAETATPPDLTDQYGKPYSYQNMMGQPLLLIVADARKLRWIGSWEKKLRRTLPELRSYRVTGVLKKPTPTVDDVAKVLRRWVPENVPIAIDINNYWATRFTLDINQPCLVLLNADGDVVAKWRGRPKKSLLREVLATLQPYFDTPTPNLTSSIATAPE